MSDGGKQRATRKISGKREAERYRKQQLQDTNERVKRHRAARNLIRVEVEVPTAEDAAAVRRFAQGRRRNPSQTQTPLPKPLERPTGASQTLEAILRGLPPDALEALRCFAEGLNQVRSQELLVRGMRVAANYRDAVEMAARVSLDHGNEN